MSGMYTSAILDLRTLAGHSSKEDWSREAPVIAEEDNFSAVGRVAEPLPDFKESPTDETRMVHHETFK